MSASCGETSTKPARARSQRLAPDDRKRQILRAAVHYFAEVGFDGGTPELARRLQVTQPLIYRYFPSKEGLIQAVYQDVYLTRWQPDWERALGDTAQPIQDRLITFYTQFPEAVFTPE
jgi:AcrR family transcriptional regulator